MIVMPIFSSVSPKFTYSMALEGISYTFSFLWNYRESAWYMSIGDLLNNSIKAGIKVVSGYSLLSRLRAYAVPPGDFVIMNVSPNPDLLITLTNLGDSFQMVYFSAAEIAVKV